MEYWSVLISGVFGAVGAGLGYVIMSKFTKNKNFILVSSIVISILSYQIIKPMIYDNSAKNIMIELNKELENNLEEMNKNLPKMLDDATRMNSISTNDGEFIYHYTIIKKEITVEYIKSIKNDVRQNTCKIKFLRYLIKNNIQITYNYEFLDKKDTVTIYVTKC